MATVVNQPKDTRGEGVGRGLSGLLGAVLQNKRTKRLDEEEDLLRGELSRASSREDAHRLLGTNASQELMRRSGESLTGFVNDIHEASAEYLAVTLGKDGAPRYVPLGPQSSVEAAQAAAGPGVSVISTAGIANAAAVTSAFGVREDVRQGDEALDEDARQANQSDTTRRAELAETTRSHQVDEFLKSQSLIESRRANIAGENLRGDELSESIRSSGALESFRLENLGTQVSFKDLDEAFRRDQFESDRQIQLGNLAVDQGQLMQNARKVGILEAQLGIQQAVEGRAAAADKAETNRYFTYTVDENGIGRLDLLGLYDTPQAADLAINQLPLDTLSDHRPLLVRGGAQVDAINDIITRQQATRGLDIEERGNLITASGRMTQTGLDDVSQAALWNVPVKGVVNWRVNGDVARDALKTMTTTITPLVESLDSDSSRQIFTQGNIVIDETLLLGVRPSVSIDVANNHQLSVLFTQEGDSSDQDKVAASFTDKVGIDPVSFYGGIAAISPENMRALPTWNPDDNRTIGRVDKPNNGGVAFYFVKIPRVGIVPFSRTMAEDIIAAEVRKIGSQ